MKLRRMSLIVAGAILLWSCSVIKNRKNAATDSKLAVVKIDTAKKNAGDTTIKNVLKPYREVITAKAVSDSGLFIVHKLDDKYFFEIPDSLLNKDILVVTRIARAATGIRPVGHMFGYAGDKIGENIIRFSKGPNYRLFINQVSYSERSSDTSVNGMYRSVVRSNLNPIITSFEIKALSKDSSASVVDITDWINADNSLIYFNPGTKKTWGLAALQKDKSYVVGIQSFPINIELKVVNTYAKGDETATCELNASFVLLPWAPMKPRYFDYRVGYFASGYIDFDAPSGVEVISMINRWRLEPKEEDQKRYLKGALVEPKQPIVYYIDPATPQKWVPYLIQGVNDWQKAFEKAGFKNAIYALPAPTNDSTFSLFDARHNAIIYKPSIVQNASGPSISDPRTGEILETHINWYHNIQQLLHDWYMVQAGPNDCNARKMVFDDKLMGELIRFVCSHEVGHTLGLQHNFGASSTVPVDSLRNKAYVDKYGFCPSIMDYARFNYVAQPEDGFTEKELFPRIGMYDEWAIDWGYRWLPQLKTNEQEKAYMNSWIISQLKKDKRYWFGEQWSGYVDDPRCQSEDIGDDAMKAGEYGIKNLKRVMASLKDWTKEPNADYSALARLSQEVLNQYARYALHVTNNIGMYTTTPRRQEEDGAVIGYIPRKKQQEAVQFLSREVFETPNWLMNKEIFSRVGGFGEFAPGVIQELVLQELLLLTPYNNMIFASHVAPVSERYTFDELLTDLEKEIWKELKTDKPIDKFRRTLQRIYIERLVMTFDLVGTNNPGGSAGLTPSARLQKLRSDFLPIIRRHFDKIVNDVNVALLKYKDVESISHLKAIRDRIKKAIDPNVNILGGSTSRNGNAFNENTIEELKMSFLVIPKNRGSENTIHRGCWDDGFLKRFLENGKD